MVAKCYMPTAPVNKIIPFSNVDGPGNRAVVFLQGCCYNCGFCHNPETICLCLNCGDCLSVCPADALFSQNKMVTWNPSLCTACDACISICPNTSSPKVRQMTAGEVMSELSDAMPFITGLTVSGGECTMYDTFLAELFGLAHAASKHTMADTNGWRLFSKMPTLLENMDAAALDIKSTDEAEHLALTGAPLEPVLLNLDFLAQAGKLYEVRTVIAPGRLDSHRTVHDTALKIATYPDVRYKLIRFRPHGVRGEWATTPVPDDTLMQELSELAKAHGVGVVEIV